MTLSYRSALHRTKAAKEDIMFLRTMMLAVALTFPLTLAAQEPPPIAVVAHVLSLSEDQVHALGEFLQARAEAVRPAAEQLQARQQALAEQLQSSAPDPAVVGRLVIESKNIQEQIQTTIATANKTLDGILNTEQRTRLEQLRGAAAGPCGVIPAFKAIGLM
jgi:septal ring factor EnvC (AmiA/AmiB activator)